MDPIQRGSDGFKALSQVTVVETKSGRILLILSPCTLKKTRILEIDHVQGVLLSQPKDCVQEFPSHEDAMEYLGGMSDGVKTSENGTAVLGFVVVAGWVCVLVSKRTRVSATLPGGHRVNVVTSSSWMRIPLKGFDRTKVSKDEMKNLNTFTDYAIEGVHFYCETLDVSCPFPGRPGSEQCAEFVWNDWLSVPFWKQGLHQFCPKLYQGFAESFRVKDSKGVSFEIAHFCRRSRLHPGTRYLARGINAGGSCGNEIECEILIWKTKSQACNKNELPFTSYVWRRGSVPIWWGVDIKNTVGEAEIWVKKDDSYQHTARYFRRLRKQYMDKRGNMNSSANFSVTCVNLLRCAPGRSELKLSEGFQKGVRSANKMISNMDLKVLNFDWHANTKALGEKGTIKGLWMSINNNLKDIGFNSGVITLKNANSGNDAALPSGFTCAFSKKQKGVLRYNCADSLDRTNVASFFGAVPALLQQCQELDLDMIKTPDLPEDVSKVLPEGWEARKDRVTGKTFYIDHNTKQTTWECPHVPLPDKSISELAANPWWVLDAEISHVSENVSNEMLGTLMEQFKVEGDLNAMLYTGSRAMHSAILQQILPEEQQKQKSHSSGVTSNAVFLSVKRRYLNIVVDGHRQQQIEMFLGLKTTAYFPSLLTFCPYEPKYPHSDGEEEEAVQPVTESSVDLLGLELKETMTFDSSKSLESNSLEELTSN